MTGVGDPQQNIVEEGDVQFRLKYLRLSMNSKFPSATLPIIFNTLLASSLLGRTVVGIASRLDEMEGTSLMSLAPISSSPMCINVFVLG
jgi:hypothetical protein